MALDPRVPSLLPLLNGLSAGAAIVDIECMITMVIQLVFSYQN